jgi:hypothetical protein
MRLGEDSFSEGSCFDRAAEIVGAFSPGLKPGHCKIERSRGFENPLPRTEVRGWHIRDGGGVNLKFR